MLTKLNCPNTTMIEYQDVKKILEFVQNAEIGGTRRKTWFVSLSHMYVSSAKHKRL